MAKIQRLETSIPQVKRRNKVAAYARVSKSTERTMHSMSAQISYYNDLIQKNPAWEFAGVYSDEAVPGGSKEKRPGFQELLNACDAGKVEIFPRRLIQSHAHGGVENGLKQRLSADLSVLPKAFFFYSTM